MQQPLVTPVQQQLLPYVLQLADTSLVLGQRLCAWCGHGPVLEQDIALSNIALDLLGQCRSLYQYAAGLQGGLTTADDLAFLRSERAFYNLLLVEQENGDFAVTIARQFFFDVFQYYQLQQLQTCCDETLCAIAEKSVKEAAYHLKWSAEWMIRLGDGTDTSRQKLQQAVDRLWPFTGEMFTPCPVEKQLEATGILPPLSLLQQPWASKVAEVLEEATLVMPPAGTWMQLGGKEGLHTELLGYLLAEMQYLPRQYPGVQW